MSELLHLLLFRAFERLPLGRRYSLVSHLAKRCNISGFVVPGAYGAIQGSSDDTSVLKAYAETGRWAARVSDLLTAFLHEGGTFLDLGANIGLTTIPVARNPRIRCIAVEPEPRNAANLAANVAANCPHGNVAIRQVAVFSERRRLEFELSSGNLGDHRIRLGQAPGRLGEEGRRIIEVEALPLDEIAEGIEGPLAVKIDTQGSEPFVAAGGSRTLARAGLLVSEFWPYAMARMGGPIDGLLDAFASFGAISIALREDEPVPPAVPAAEACRTLAGMVRTRSQDPYFYADVIATR